MTHFVELYAIFLLFGSVYSCLFEIKSVSLRTKYKNKDILWY